VRRRIKKAEVEKPQRDVRLFTRRFTDQLSSPERVIPVEQWEQPSRRAVQQEWEKRERELLDEIPDAKREAIRDGQREAFRRIRSGSPLLERKRISLPLDVAAAKGWSTYLRGRWWQIYMKGTFAREVNEAYAHRAGVDYVPSLGHEAYGAVFWGQGSVGGRFHIHLLLGGLWNGHPNDIQVRRTIRWLERRWEQHGLAVVDRYDANRGACEYLTDHHETDIVGRPKRMRLRKQRLTTGEITDER
jgi:hypothetical protein